jgi:hypothetical protein
MQRLRANWRPLVVLSLFLGLAIYFHSFLITNVFEPVAVLFWAVWRIIASVHQNIYWTTLVLLCSLLLIRFLPFRRNSAGPAYPPEHSSPNRVEDWLRLMKNASPGTDETEYLRDRLKRLLLSVHQAEQAHSLRVDEMGMQESEFLPEAVRRFLFPTKEKHDFRSQLFLLLPIWLRKGANKIFQIDTIAIEETLTWMESMMEINNDQ